MVNRLSKIRVGGSGEAGPKRPATNRLGLIGWLNPYRYNLERYAYTLQRISGVGIMLYFIGHIVETGTIVGGPEAWDSTLAFTQNPGGHLILLLLLLALGFHGVNGIRLILTEFGILIGRPARPDYPYVPKSLSAAQKLHLWAAVLVALLAAAYGFMVLFGGG